MECKRNFVDISRSYFRLYIYDFLYIYVSCRRVAVFGLTLVPLDIRQESTRHTLALDAITRYLGVGAYAQWDEDTRSL